MFLSIHKGPSVDALITSLFNQTYGTDFEILYGFRYSPDLNPIELFWKAMRDCFDSLAGFDNIVDRIFYAASSIPNNIIVSFILHGKKMFFQAIKF